ncbi:MAG TPA: class I SAM-dependent methyltransferase [Caulobacteraceae bacterium]|jgi:SAM-dependent methyltransferase|nr:class I SAM-dependent methyltransferase [Caulobacteraceae bacterium]
MVVSSRPHEAVVKAQFGPRAAAYVESPTHARGEDLDRIEALARERRAHLAVDLGCGGGHVAYRLARWSRRVVAIDLAEEMLNAVAARAESLSLPVIETLRGAAEDIPLDDGAADLVVTRFSAHHWTDLDAGLRETRRVLRADGALVVVDVISPGVPALDTHLQAVELLRDPSHVRDYGAGEWLAALERAGFAVSTVLAWRLPIEFPAWIDRMATPPVQAQAVRALQQQASDATRAYFAIEADGSFVLDALIIEARPR